MSVLSIYSLPDVLYSKLRTTMVSMSENGGVICIEPIVQNRGRRKLRGMLSDGKLSVDNFLKMMREDKEVFET